MDLQQYNAAGYISPITHGYNSWCYKYAALTCFRAASAVTLWPQKGLLVELMKNDFRACPRLRIEARYCAVFTIIVTPTYIYFPTWVYVTSNKGTFVCSSRRLAFVGLISMADAYYKLIGLKWQHVMCSNVQFAIPCLCSMD